MNVTVTQHGSVEYLSAQLGKRLGAAMHDTAIELREVMREHILSLDAEGNRNGWWRSHFWKERIYPHVQVSWSETTATAAVVRIHTHLFTHKVNPVNPLRPKHAQFLKIPLTSEAKQLAAAGVRIVPNTFIVRTLRGKLLVGRRLNREVEWLYTLKKEVHQFPHSHPFPDRETVRSRCMAVFEKVFGQKNP